MQPAPNDKSESKLVLAAVDARADEVEQLIANGEPVNVVSAHGIPPLHFAAERNHKDIIEMLLAAHADVNAQDAAGNTALHWAAERVRRRAAKTLLAGGADVNAVNKDGMSPLHVAAANLMDPTLVDILLQNGADPSKRDAQGRTPLDVLNTDPTMRENADVVRAILTEHKRTSRDSGQPMGPFTERHRAATSRGHDDTTQARPPL